MVRALHTGQSPNNMTDLKGIWDALREQRELVKKYWSSGAELMSLLANEEIYATVALVRTGGRSPAGRPSHRVSVAQGHLFLDGIFVRAQGNRSGSRAKTARFHAGTRSLHRRGRGDQNYPPSLDPQKVQLTEKIKKMPAFDPTGKLEGYLFAEPGYWNSHQVEWTEKWDRIKAGAKPPDLLHAVGDNSGNPNVFRARDRKKGRPEKWATVKKRAMVEFKGIMKRFGSVVAVDRLGLYRRGRHAGDAAGSFGMRKDHIAAHGGRARRAQRRRHPGQRLAHQRHPDPQAQPRNDFPELRLVPPQDHFRQRGVRFEISQRGQRCHRGKGDARLGDGPSARRGKTHAEPAVRRPAAAHRPRKGHRDRAGRPSDGRTPFRPWTKT